MIKSILFICLIAIVVLSACHDLNGPSPKKDTTQLLKGKVILQNRNEYSNTLVYIENMDRGVSTDSNGYYQLSFTSEDSTYDGVNSVVFYLNDYDSASAKFLMRDGHVIIDTLDVDEQGMISTIVLPQIVLVEGKTDKSEYIIGDTIKYSATFTNISSKIVNIFIPSLFNQLGHVGLYNNKYPTVIISPIDPVSMDLNINLNPGQQYEGNVAYSIPSGFTRDTEYIPFLPDKYFVTTSLSINGRLKNTFSDKLTKYILQNWSYLNRGVPPLYDLFPNKYNFPIIDIIQ